MPTYLTHLLLDAGAGTGLTVKELLAVIGVGGSILGGSGFAAWFLARSQSAKYISDAAKTVVEMYQTHAKDLEAKLAASENECSQKMDELRGEMHTHVQSEIEKAIAAHILRTQVKR